MDRISAKATPEGTLNYTYDAVGNVESITSGNVNGASMSYAYDDLDRLLTVTDNRLTGNNVTTYSYDNASNVATVSKASMHLERRKDRCRKSSIAWLFT